MIAANDPLADAIPPGETVRWTGSAPQGLRLRSADAFLIPLSLIWTAFVCLWEWTAVTLPGPNVLFEIWGVPFVAAGAYVTVGRFFVDAWLRGRTRYAVTDRAAYVMRGAPFGGTRRFSGSALGTMTYDPRAGGRATIVFDRPQVNLRTMRGAWAFWSGARMDAFEAIPDGASVYAMLTRLAG